MTQTKSKYRRKKGFEKTSSLLSFAIRKASETRGFAVSKVLTHWHEIVGADIANIARPVEISYGRGGMGATLTVLTTGAQAPMLEMQREIIREKVNSVYGYNAIARLRITQTAATGFSEGQAVFSPAPAAKIAENPEIALKAQQWTPKVTDDGLRKALETLAKNVLIAQEHKGTSVR